MNEISGPDRLVYIRMAKLLKEMFSSVKEPAIPEMAEASLSSFNKNHPNYKKCLGAQKILYSIACKHKLPWVTNTEEKLPARKKIDYEFN